MMHLNGNYAPESSGTTPLLSADGSTFLPDKDAILKRWTEHFDRLPSVECNVLLDEFPSVNETTEAI